MLVRLPKRKGGNDHQLPVGGRDRLPILRRRRAILSL
jgi:hypothetical protein